MSPLDTCGSAVQFVRERTEGTHLLWENRRLTASAVVNRSCWLIPACIVLVMALHGCLAPIAMHRAVLEYDHTVGQVEAEMLLLNIARAKQGHPIHFTVVSNVAATFDFRANGGLGGQLFDGGGEVFAKNFYTFNLGASVAENPTVSIIPVQGEEFTKRLLTPMDESKFQFLINQGIEPAIILRLMARGIGVEQGGFRSFLLNLPHQRDEYQEFRRRILHLSALNAARQLHVGPIVYEEPWPLPLEHPLSSQAFDKGYRWVAHQIPLAPRLSRPVSGRIVITNYDVAKLSNDERRELQQDAERYPWNYVLVDIRPGFPGGDYPWHGQIKLRSFNAMLAFVARGMEEEPEFVVEPDMRSGPVARNPVSTLPVRETDSRAPESVFAVELGGRWYNLDLGERDPAQASWNREAFVLLSQLYQMTVTDVGSAPALPITIAK